MGGISQTVTLVNTDTGATEPVDPSEVSAKLATGRYKATSTEEAAGGYARRPEDVSQAAAAGEQLAPREHLGVQEAEGARRAGVNTAYDKALTFAEGAVDAFSLGLIHETGDLADLRREVNSGSAFVGQITGTVAGLATGIGPLKAVAGGGEAIGAAAARAVRAGPVITRGLTEAGMGAALAGVASTGHQLTDALIEDKAFSAEAALHELKVGGLLAGGLGILGGGLSRLSRGAVEAQGGLVAGDVTEILPHVRGAVEGMDQAVETHAARLRMLQLIEPEGKINISADLIKSRTDALVAARKARAAVGDVEAGLSTQDPKVYKAFRTAVDEYQGRLTALDDLMRARNFEVMPITRFGKVGDIPGLGQTPMSPEELLYGEKGFPEGNKAVNDAMREGGPRVQDAYEQAHGRPWQPVPEPAPAVSVEGGSGAEAIQGVEEAHPAVGAEQVTGGRPRKGRPAPAEAPTPPAESPPLASEPARVPLMITQDMKARLRGLGYTEDQIFNMRPAEAHANLAAGPARGAVVKEAGAKVGPGQLPGYEGHLTAADVPAEALGAAPRPWSPALRDQLRLPEGYMLPARDSLQNAQAFKAFKDKLDRIKPDVPVQAPSGRPGGLDELNAALGIKPEYGPKGPVGIRETTQGERATREWVDDWFRESQKYGPRVTPGDQASVKISQTLDDLHTASGGRVDSVAGLELGAKYGLPKPTTALGERLDQVWLLRKAAAEATEAAKGAKGGGLAGKLAKKALGAAVGYKTAGVLGALAGEMIGGYASTAGKVAGAAGRLTQKVAQVGAKLLSPRVPGTVASAAVAANRPVAYSDAGPIADPVKRIQELHRVAAAPEEIRAKVAANLGDMMVTAPEFGKALQDATVRQVQALSLKAPAIYFDKLGTALGIPQSDLRRFHETENAAHDFEAVLAAMAAGTVTRAQAEAAQAFYPAAHARVVADLMADPETLKGLPQVKLQAVERLLGVDLHGTGPMGLARSAAAWASPSPGQRQAMGQKPQAFKLSGSPDATPTPAQAGPKAPGN